VRNDGTVRGPAPRPRLPLGLVVGDGPGRYEAVANGDPGLPLGRELELADLLRDLKRHRVRNVVWITADVH
jgi:alkaline phosphatase D